MLDERRAATRHLESASIVLSADADSGDDDEATCAALLLMMRTSIRLPAQSGRIGHLATRNALG